MEYFIPIQFALLIDLIDRINEIAVDIQDDILKYNILSTPIDHRDSKKIVYHHLIQGLCKNAVNHRVSDTYFVYSPHRLSFTKLNALFGSNASQIKTFIEEFLQVCQKTIGLQIIKYNGGAKKLYEDYQTCSGEAISALNTMTRIATKNDKRSQLKFFQQYGLKYLYENHFKNINYLILTTSS